MLRGFHPVLHARTDRGYTVGGLATLTREFNAHLPVLSVGAT